MVVEGLEIDLQEETQERESVMKKLVIIGLVLLAIGAVSAQAQCGGLRVVVHSAPSAGEVAGLVPGGYQQPQVVYQQVGVDYYGQPIYRAVVVQPQPVYVYPPQPQPGVSFWFRVGGNGGYHHQGYNRGCGGNEQVNVQLPSPPRLPRLPTPPRVRW